MSSSPLPVDAAESPLPAPAWFERTMTWLSAHERAVLGATAVFQFLVLIGMIVLHIIPLVAGERILLHVEPVDPRELFRGDYVILSYPFSRIPPAGIQGLANVAGNELDGRTIYVSLEPDADGVHWSAAGVSTDRPKTGKYIRGKYEAAGWGGPLRFGIEAYYVQEHEGIDLERVRNAHQLSAEIALTQWGQAALSGLHID